MYHEYAQGAFTISTNPHQLNLDIIHQYLTEESYWAQQISRSLVEKSIQHSLNFGVYHQHEQVGFARVVTDYATFALLCDVFILPAHRGQGLSKWLISVIVAHPDLQGLRRFALYTQDAHTLYAPFGFCQIADPRQAMEIKNLNPYHKQARQ